MIRPKNKKNILKNIKSHMFLTLFLCMGIWVFDTNTVSASTHLEETKIQIIDNAVGRYKLNYTGNTNHFTTWSESGRVEEQKIYDDVGGWANSSSAYLTPQADNSTIKYAFLVWESKTTEKEGFTPMESPVYFITPTGQTGGTWIYPQYIIKDNRDNWDGKNYDNYGSICTMVTDVTSIVKQSGFGKYSVCNIPMWEPSPASMLSNGTYPAGESPSSWQLVIVEESRDFNVRAVSLSVTSEFHLATDFTGRLVLENGLKSTTTGYASGQFLFGMVRSDATASVTEYINTRDSHGNVLTNALGQTINKAGLYRNGAVQNNRDTANGGVCVDLSDISNIGSGATSAELYVRNDTLWTAFTMLGASFDVSYPDFEGIQTTTANDDVTEVKVEGSFKNIAVPADTGIYDGNLEIIVDEGLTPISATAKVNGTLITTVPTINGNVVKFSGSEVRNMMNGDDISYTVLCTVNSAGAIKYENEARFNGKLRSEGANTGYWVDQIWVASSKWEREVYRIALDNQGATTAGTSCYFEWYNHGNYTTERCINAIDTIVAPTKDNYIFDGYFTGVNGTGTKYVDADGRILSDATTFTANTTLYACWIPKIYKITLDNQGAGSGKEGTLCYYEKYGVGNYADEACTTPITQITLPVKDGYTFAGYWTKTGGDSGGGIVCITTAGKVMTSSTLFTADTTIYADWESKVYTITLDNQSATLSGSSKFYEKYNEYFLYDKIILQAGTKSFSYNYTGGVQSFVAPYTGMYFLDVYGAQGSSAYATGGYGGRSYGVVTLEQGETLYIYVGGQGSGETGGWNGGSDGAHFIDWWAIGGGGGGTDIRRGGTAVDNRIIVAGGGGGSTLANRGNTYYLQGGNGGGTNYQAFNVTITDGYYFTGVSSSTATSVTYNPQQLHTASGAGGGGGYYGGRAKNGATTVPAGEGGTGYVGGVTAGNVGGINYGVTSVAGQRSGAGYAVITRSNYTTQQTVTTKIDPPKKTGYYFKGYFTGENGTGTPVTDSQGNIVVSPDFFTSNTTVHAYWSTSASITYRIRFNGNGATSGTMADMKCAYGQTYNLIPNAFKKDGYHFVKWTMNPDGSGQSFTDKQSVKNLTSVGGAIVNLYAQWEANSYTITFHPNDGKEATPLEDIVTQYDADISLPDVILDDGTHAYVKYTLDGVDITDQVLAQSIILAMDGTVVYQGEPLPEGSSVAADGTITYPDGNIVYPDGTTVEPVDESGTSGESVEETPEEPGTSGEQVEDPSAEENVTQTEAVTIEKKEVSRVAEPEDGIAEQSQDQDAYPQADKKAYASVFMGWSLEDGKDSFIPQWNVGEMSVSNIIDAAGMTNQDGAIITLYAVWDDCPWITATHLYYTLEQAQSGFITDTEILSHATAYDREDGSPIEPGFHDNGTSFSIPDYAATDFTQFLHEGSCTENLTVVDSSGSVYAKQITVYVVDTTPVAVEPEGTTRFINEYYYNQPYEYGGLEDNSIWKTDPEYVAALQMTFDNIKNDTSVQTYYFTHEDILAMKEFISKNGIGNTRYDDAQQRFYNQFMEPKLVQ